MPMCCRRPSMRWRRPKISDARLAKGDARPLEGIPLGHKDLFCTNGVRTTACSNILGNFVPTYESTVGANLWNAGAVMLGKLNNDEFAMGSSNETSAFGPVVSPWRRKDKNGTLDGREARPRRLVGRLIRRCRSRSVSRRHRHRHRRLDPPACSADRHRRHQAHLWPLLALGDRRLRLVARSGGPHRQDGGRRGPHARRHGWLRSQGFPPASMPPFPTTPPRCAKA